MKILFVAGEISGDKNASYLIRKILERNDGVKIYAFGGKEMEKSGAILIEDITHKAVVGFTEIFDSISYFKNLLKKIFYFVRENNIKKVVLVDFPGFNLRLAKSLKNLNIKIYYYIPPQVWAWGSWRIKALRRYIDFILSIFPFETDFLREKGVNAFYVGNPLLERIKWNTKKENSIIFLPGSRKREIKRHIEDMIKIRDKLEEKFSNYKFYISLLYEDEIFVNKLKDKFEIIKEDPSSYISKSKYAVTVSGTASLECALAGTPLVVIYKVSEITYYLAKLLTRVPYVSLVNIIKNKRIIPEFIQHINHNKIFDFLVSLEYSPQKYYKYIDDLNSLRKILQESKITDPVYLILNS